MYFFITSLKYELHLIVRVIIYTVINLETYFKHDTCTVFHLCGSDVHRMILKDAATTFGSFSSSSWEIAISRR